MEMTKVTPELNLYDKDWPIWTYQEQQPPPNSSSTTTTAGQAPSIRWFPAAASSPAPASSARCSFPTSTSIAGPGRGFGHPAPRSDVGRHAVLQRCVVDKRCKIPPGLVAGVNAADDRRRFHVSPRASPSSPRKCSARAPAKSGLSRGRTRLPLAHASAGLPPSGNRPVHPALGLAPRHQGLRRHGGHLERHPGHPLHGQFRPVLLDQIEDYGDQFATRAGATRCSPSPAKTTPNASPPRNGLAPRHGLPLPPRPC